MLKPFEKIIFYFIFVHWTSPDNVGPKYPDPVASVGFII